MKELQMTIKQERTFFRLYVECESTEANKVAVNRIFGSYEEANGIISTSLNSPSIIKLASMQMALICELSENGQI